jgi:hypothetical protein
MNYQYLLQLPQHLEPALKAGKILVESGVVRDVGSKAIVAHLEMVETAGPQVLGALGTVNPVFAVAGVALKTASDTTKLNKIMRLTQEIKSLSTINLAVSGATLGVVVAGFAVVLYQLDRIDKKLDGVSIQIQRLDSKISKNELSKLMEKVKRHIKSCISLIHQLEDLGWSDYLDTVILNLFDSIEALMERILDNHFDRGEINVSLEMTQCLQSAYANLLKAYLTKRYLQNKSLNYPVIRLQTLEKFSKELCSPEILDELYEEYVVSKEYRFTEEDLDVILALYRYGCQNTSNNVNVHYEILQTTPRSQFNRWQQLLKTSDQPLIWLEH